MKTRNIEELIGKTLKSVEHTATGGEDEIVFSTTDDEEYLLFHNQDCCENVYLEDVVGELDDLVGSPILIAKEDTNADDPRKAADSDDSYTWSFYNIATTNGHVTLRWYGASNGYYSESVDFIRIKRYSNFEDAKKGAGDLGKDYYIPVWGTDDTRYTIYF